MLKVLGLYIARLENLKYMHIAFSQTICLASFFTRNFLKFLK